MSKVLILLAVLLLTGCKSLFSFSNGGITSNKPQIDFTPAEIEGMTDSIMEVKAQLREIRNQPPLPPAVPKKRTMRALSIPTVPDKWIVVKWDSSMETNILYRLKWKQVRDPSGQALVWESAEGSYDLNQTKVDVVALFKSLGVPTGWYQLTVSSVNDLFVPSEEIAACYLVWYPEL